MAKNSHEQPEEERAAAVEEERVEGAAKETPEAVKEAEAEVPAVVKESWTQKARDVFETLSDKGKQFVGKIYERVKSSELVQNLGDRFEIWRNIDKAGRISEKLAKVTAEERQAAGAAKKAEEMATKREAEVQEAEALLKSMGRELPERTRSRAESDISVYETKAEKARSSTQNIAETRQALEARWREHETKINEARGRLDGRLEAKMEANSDVIEQFQSDKTERQGGTIAQEAKIEELRIQEAQLQDFIGRLDSKSPLYPEMTRQLKAVQKERGTAESVVTRLKEEAAVIDLEIAKLQTENSKFQAERDKIFGRTPETKKAGPGTAKAGEPKKDFKPEESRPESRTDPSRVLGSLSDAVEVLPYLMAEDTPDEVEAGLHQITPGMRSWIAQIMKKKKRLTVAELKKLLERRKSRGENK